MKSYLLCKHKCLVHVDLSKIARKQDLEGFGSHWCVIPLCRGSISKTKGAILAIQYIS